MIGPDPCLEALRVLGHELRRPLTVLRGAATLLIDDGGALPEAGRRQMLTLIDRGASEMADLIDDLLTAVHLEQRDIEYRSERIPLAGLVQEAVHAALRLDPERAIAVSGVAGFEVVADPEQAARALRAVVVNAVQHSPAAAPVEVVAATEADVVRVEVRDRGPGIPADRRERAFEKFARLEGTAAGAGLGLFLARGLARAMGGDVELSGREDGGTVVCFTLRRRG
ncbi:MAG TPA: HAMP domain-containing sensor histidine kinase [Candidatus Dormibacteraeota bacterium]|nr:HAMP domain-containing sensor histidine kinase [Candidatus Dormibacteraeota bacterium]